MNLRNLVRVAEREHERVGVETAGLNREAISGNLEERGVDEDLLAAYNRVLEDSEYSRFAPSAERRDMHELYGEAAQLIKQLEGKL